MLEDSTISRHWRYVKALFNVLPINDFTASARHDNNPFQVSVTQNRREIRIDGELSELRGRFRVTFIEIALKNRIHRLYGRRLPTRH